MSLSRKAREVEEEVRAKTLTRLCRTSAEDSASVVAKSQSIFYPNRQKPRGRVIPWASKNGRGREEETRDSRPLPIRETDCPGLVELPGPESRVETPRSHDLGCSERGRVRRRAPWR